MPSPSDGLSTLEVVTLAIALYGAVLSSIVVGRAIWAERRRVKLVVKPIWWQESRGGGNYVILPLIRLRVVGEGRRPAHVRQAHVITAGGSHFHPRTVTPKDGGNSPPALLADGDSVAFYWNVRSFEEDGYLPTHVVVRGDQEREFKARLGRRERRAIASMLKQAIERDSPYHDGRT